MRKTFWDRNVRPGIVVGSIVIFCLLLHGFGSTGGGDRKRYFSGLQPNVQRKSVRNQQSYSGSGRSRHLLGVLKGIQDEQATTEATGLTKKDQNGSLPVSSDNPVSVSPCGNPWEHTGYSDSCSYVKAATECKSGTLLEYLEFFFCTCSGMPILAYTVLVAWLLCLFYMLGNTAADFFCCNIEKLAELMHLPPTVSGVTLLPLGNGAPDVFASIAAFIGASGQGQVGLNSVLGGATFVSSVVAGSVSLVVALASAHVQLDRRCFLRDVGFFLLTLMVLTSILFAGQITFWGSIAYISIYGVYAIAVAAVEFLRSQSHKLAQWHALQPLLDVESSLPQWTWGHVAMYSNQTHHDGEARSEEQRLLWGREERADVRWYSPRGLFKYCVEWPLTIPRRLTIPLIEDDGWSKFYAVCSATFAPSLLAMVWDGNDNGPIGSAWREYIVGGSIGIVLGGIAFFTLQREHPPRRYLFPWAAGGFIMSIVWFYIVANELVAALVAIGVMLEIDPAILGLTVLAWGNSIGDLMSNLALASHGGDAVQIAFSGCYAGPMFNTIIGIGMSFALASWKSYPNPFFIPQDDTIFMTIGFLVAGLVWALYMLPTRSMQPTKAFGIGLLVLYCSFLSVRLVNALGLQSWVANSFT